MLKQFQLDSGPVAADGVSRYMGPWTCPHKVSIRKILTWVGSAGQLTDQPHFPAVDIHATVFTNGIVAAFLGLDHYDNFSAPHQWTETYDKGDIILEPGQPVTVGYAGTSLSPSVPSTIHVMVLVWYEDCNG